MENCPLNGKCLEACIVYKAEVSIEGKYAIYYRTAYSNFKSRYNNHTMCFWYKSHTKDTETSKYLPNEI